MIHEGWGGVANRAPTGMWGGGCNTGAVWSADDCQEAMIQVESGPVRLD